MNLFSFEYQSAVYLLKKSQWPTRQPICLQAIFSEIFLKPKKVETLYIFGWRESGASIEGSQACLWDVGQLVKFQHWWKPKWVTKTTSSLASDLTLAMLSTSRIHCYTYIKFKITLWHYTICRIRMLGEARCDFSIPHVRPFLRHLGFVLSIVCNIV